MVASLLMLLSKITGSQLNNNNNNNKKDKKTKKQNKTKKKLNTLGIRESLGEAQFLKSAWALVCLLLFHGFPKVDIKVLKGNGSDLVLKNVG